MINQSEKILLLLIGRALFNKDVKLPSDVDWNTLYNEAINQTVLPLVYSNLTAEEKATIPKESLSQWEKVNMFFFTKSQRVLYEQQNVLNLLLDQKFKCAILKGSSAAINYPEPNLRIMGDIDILVDPNEQENVIKLLQKNGYSSVRDEEHQFHLGVSKNNITVEVHKRSNGLLFNEDSVIKEKIDIFFADTLEEININNGTPMLDDGRQALVLIIHKLEHFISGGLGLRQVCDWATFVDKRLTEKLWDEIRPFLEEIGLLLFTKVITKVCMLYLGLPKDNVPFDVDCDLELSERVMNHILNSGNFGIKDRAYGEHFFVDAHSKNRITSMFKQIKFACKTHWPVCERYPILMTVAPIVVYFRYLKQRIHGEREKFQPIKLYKRSGSKQQLYKELRPFITVNSNKKDG